MSTSLAIRLSDLRIIYFSFTTHKEKFAEIHPRQCQSMGLLPRFRRLILYNFLKIVVYYDYDYYMRVRKCNGSENSASWHEIYTRAKVNLYLRQRQSIHCSAVLNLLLVIDASRSYARLYDMAYISGTMNMKES